MVEFINPGTTWQTDVVGLQEAKMCLVEAVILPFKFPQLFTGVRRPPFSSLLFGPPGVGKTLLAKSLRNEFNKEDVHMLYVHVSDFMYQHNDLPGEQQVRNLFMQARSNTPCILILDDLQDIPQMPCESMTVRMTLSELLVQCQDLSTHEHQVFLIGISNNPQTLARPLRRQFCKLIHVPMPDYDSRLGILNKELQAVNHSLSVCDMEDLALRTHGYSSSDLVVLCREVAMHGVRLLMKFKYFRKISKEKLPLAVSDAQYSCTESCEEAGVDGDHNTVLYEICEASDDGAEELHIMEIPVDSIQTLPIIMTNVLQCLEKVKPSVRKEDIDACLNFYKYYCCEVKSLVMQCCTSLQTFIKTEHLKTVVPELCLPRKLRNMLMRID